jgi:hypothetical protein
MNWKGFESMRPLNQQGTIPEFAKRGQQKKTQNPFRLWNRGADRNSNRGSLEYKSRKLPLIITNLNLALIHGTSERNIIKQDMKNLSQKLSDYKNIDGLSTNVIPMKQQNTLNDPALNYVYFHFLLRLSFKYAKQTIRKFCSFKLVLL